MLKGIVLKHVKTTYVKRHIVYKCITKELANQLLPFWPKDLKEFLGCNFITSHLLTRKVEGRSPPFTDGPSQRGFHRRSGLIDVITIKAEAGLQSKRIAGAKAGQADVIHFGGQEALSYVTNLVIRHRYL